MPPEGRKTGTVPGMRAPLVAALVAVLAVAACKKDAPPAPAHDYGPVAKKEQAVNLPAPGTPPPAVAAPAELAAAWTLPLKTLKGEPTTLGAYQGKAVLVVNVASQCGLTPQYAALEAVQDKYAGKGFTVVGFPCNQFGGQEPGTAEEIAEFCSTNYGISFPIMERSRSTATPSTRSTRRSPRSPTPAATPARSGGTSRSS